MPWNEPGGNGNKDPWGKKEQGPPDLDKFLSDLLKKVHGFFKGKNRNSTWQPSMNQEVGFVFGVVLVLVAVAWILSGLFIVNPAEETVILRFGKYSETLQPGLHWFARFIEAKYTVDVQKIYAFPLQGDFLTKSSDQNDMPNQYVPVPAQKNSAEGFDQSKNLVNVELNVQYRIQNPRDYLFNLVDPDSTIKEVAAGALSDMVGQMKLDEVLTTGREVLSSGVLERVKKVLAPYNSGIEVVAVTLRKVQAPDQVRAAFSDVNRADQDKATSIQQAQAYASKIVPLAQGVAARILADATGYQQQTALAAQANIAKYQALLEVYNIAPEVTRERMYLDTMQTVFQKTSKILLDSGSGNNLIYLPLDKLVKPEEVDSSEESKMISSQNLPTALSLSRNDLTNNASQPTGGEVTNDTTN